MTEKTFNPHAKPSPPRAPTMPSKMITLSKKTEFYSGSEYNIPTIKEIVDWAQENKLSLDDISIDIDRDYDGDIKVCIQHSAPEVVEDSLYASRLRIYEKLQAEYLEKQAKYNQDMKDWLQFKAEYDKKQKDIQLAAARKLLREAGELP